MLTFSNRKAGLLFMHYFLTLRSNFLFPTAAVVRKKKTRNKIIILCTFNVLFMISLTPCILFNNIV